MSKSLKELQGILDKRCGIATVKESDYDRNTREILDIKLRLERIRNGLNAIKGLPQSSPLLRESLEFDLDRRAGNKADKSGGKTKTDHDLLAESYSPTYNAHARCQQCGWSGDVTVERGRFVSGTACPGCGVSPGVLIRESNSTASLRADLQESLDARASEGDSRDIRESAAKGSASDSIIDLRESAYEDNTITFTLSEGNPDDFVGKKIYLNRPTAAEKRERPERSLKDWVGTVAESFLEKRKVIVKALIHDTKLQQLLENSASRKAIGITVDSGNLCFVTDGQGLS